MPTTATTMAEPGYTIGNEAGAVREGGRGCHPGSMTCAHRNHRTAGRCADLAANLLHGQGPMATPARKSMSNAEDVVTTS